MQCKNYPGNFLKSFNDMRKQEQLCDVSINVGGRAFPAHKTVLAACSSYFLVMFTSGFKVRIKGVIRGKSVLVRSQDPSNKHKANRGKFNR